MSKSYETDIIKPISDSATAIRVTKADGTSNMLTFNSTDNIIESSALFKSSSIFNANRAEKSLGNVSLTTTNNVVNIILTQATAFSGVVEVELTGGFVNNNANGKIIKSIFVSVSNLGVVTVSSEYVRHIQGTTADVYAIGTPVNNGSTGCIIPISLITTSATNPLNVVVRLQSSGTVTFIDSLINNLALSAPYSGTAVTKNVLGILSNPNSFTSVQTFDTLALSYSAVRDLQFNFNSGAIGDTIDIILLNESRMGSITIDLVGNFGTGNVTGRITKTINFRCSSNTVYDITEQITHASGNLANYYSIGTLVYDGSNYKIPIGKIVENSNLIKARVTVISSTGTSASVSNYVNSITTSAQYNTTAPTKNVLTLNGTAPNDSLLGSEVITTTADRDMSGANNWSGTGWTVGGGVYTHVAGANPASLSGYRPVNNVSYQIVMTINTTTAGSLVISYGDASASAVGQITGTLTNYTVTLTVTENSSGLIITPDATWVGTIDDVSIKSITSSSSIAYLRTYTNTLGLEARVANGGSFGIGVNALNNNLSSATFNIAIGNLSLRNNISGSSNISIGTSSSRNLTSGSNNISIGTNSSRFSTVGTSCISIGTASLYSNISGFYNIAIGTNSLYNNINGNGLTAIGYNSGYTSANAFNSIFLGFSAGKYSTLSNKLYIDAFDRTNTAGDDAGAIITGTMSATASSQLLTFNALTTISNTTESSSVGSGSFQTLGGGSFAKNLYVGGNTNIASTKNYLVNGKPVIFSEYMGMRDFNLSFTATANQAIDLRFIRTSTSWSGTIEVEVTGLYSGTNATGKIKKIFTSYWASTDTAVSSLVESTEFTQGLITDRIAVGTLSYDATNTCFIIPISNRTANINRVTVVVRCIQSTTVASTVQAFVDGITTSPEYAGSAVVKNEVKWEQNVNIGSFIIHEKQTATIASGAITATKSYISLVGQGGTTDDLDTINGGVDGAQIILTNSQSAYTITVRDNVGNIQLVSDASLTNAADKLVLIYDAVAVKWCELGYNNNA